jgi:RNA polymerase sigma-70 factor (ECF subfamily)
MQTTSVRLSPRDPEVALMLRVKRDEPAAFAELVRLYWNKVFAHFFRGLPDRQEAEDLTQDVFLRLYRSRKVYRPRAKLNTWIFHIAANVARNALRSRRRRAFVHFSPLETGEEPLLEKGRPLHPDTSPSVPLERKEVIRLVRQAVSELVGRQRTALEMHQFQYRTYAEIAEELALTLKATKSLLYRARLQLRGNLQKLGPEMIEA